MPPTKRKAQQTDEEAAEAKKPKTGEHTAAAATTAEVHLGHPPPLVSQPQPTTTVAVAATPTALVLPLPAAVLAPPPFIGPLGKQQRASAANAHHAWMN